MTNLAAAVELVAKWCRESSEWKADKRKQLIPSHFDLGRIKALDQCAAELKTILAELGRGADRKLEQCPDGCYRPKATSADDCAAGCCSKWYAVRDKAASDECEKLAAFWKRPPVAGLAELTDAGLFALFDVMDIAWVCATSPAEGRKDVAKAAREFLGKVDG